MKNQQLPTEKKPAVQRLYYPALDGLRGIGCLLVVVYHNFYFLHQYLFFGWLAMDIFFVLSGFLITDILLNTFGEKNYLRNFYVRRILRVFPLYYTALIIFLIILPQIPKLPLQLDFFVQNQLWFWTFLQNWIIIFRQNTTQSALNHLWSMAVEEQFYLLWPLMVVWIKKPRILLALLGLLLIAFSTFRFWLWVQQIPGLSYYNIFTFTRIDGICIGCMVALLQKINRQFIGRNTAIIVTAMAVFNYVFYFINRHYNDSFPYLGLVGFSTFSAVFGILVYYIINQKSRFFTVIFDIEFLKFIGRISYGTYIFHWPIYLLINPTLIKWMQPFTSDFYSQFIASSIATVLAYVLGYLSYTYFEMKFLRLKKYFT